MEARRLAISSETELEYYKRDALFAGRDRLLRQGELQACRYALCDCISIRIFWEGGDYEHLDVMGMR